jgi:hypothetical protein
MIIIVISGISRKKPSRLDERPRLSFLESLIYNIGRTATVAFSAKEREHLSGRKHGIMRDTQYK